jgi:hypothetical protein
LSIENSLSREHLHGDGPGHAHDRVGPRGDARVPLADGGGGNDWFGVWGLGFGVLGFGVWGWGFGFWGLEFMDLG